MFLIYWLCWKINFYTLKFCAFWSMQHNLIHCNILIKNAHICYLIFTTPTTINRMLSRTTPNKWHFTGLLFLWLLKSLIKIHTLFTFFFIILNLLVHRKSLYFNKNFTKNYIFHQNFTIQITTTTIKLTNIFKKVTE